MSITQICSRVVLLLAVSGCKEPPQPVGDAESRAVRDGADADLPESRGVRAYDGEGLVARVTLDRLTVAGKELRLKAGKLPEDHVVDHLIVPLRPAMERWAEEDTRRRDASPEGACGLQLIVHADRSVPIGTVIDLLFSANRMSFEFLAIAVKHDGGLRLIDLSVPRAWSAAPPTEAGRAAAAGLPQLARGRDSEQIVSAAFVVDGDGVHYDGEPTRLDAAALTTEARSISAEDGENRSVAIQAAADVPLGEVVAVLDALRGEACDLSTSEDSDVWPPLGCLFPVPYLDLHPRLRTRNAP